MFGFLLSNDRKMRQTAGNWIEMAEKVWNYRRDQLSQADAGELTRHTEALRSKVRAKVGAADLKLSIEALEPVLSRLGGKIYPKTSMIDNVEFFLVAALVVLGIRAYIIQPFKIPTNSMWPTYHGMTADNLLLKGEDPGLAARALRLLSWGAFRHEVLAPQSGEVSVKCFIDGRLAYTVVQGRKWLVIPAEFKEYRFSVNGTEATVTVPLDFNEFDQVVHETFFGNTDGFAKAWRAAADAGRLERSAIQLKEGSPEAARAVILGLGKQVAQGQPIVRFDILTGDQLFVDRLSYHFVQPSVGDGFVFRTGNIEGIGQDQYYIKRLVGVPGDTLEIREPVLLRNGAPITGAQAFDLNARRQAPYRGYFDATTTRMSLLRKGETLTVPKDSFFAMGDNSGNSRDGRDWGFVPARDAVGRPLVIYYPFTRRWGIAR